MELKAAVKRLSRLIYNERLDPRQLAGAVLDQAIRQIPRQGKVRLALDWTIEDDQYLLVISLVIKGRGIPIFWRGYAERVLKGRMKVYEMAIIKRVLERVRGKIGRRLLIVTADRGFADVALCDVLESYRAQYIIRTRASTKVLINGEWQQLQDLSFITNSRRRTLGQVQYCQSNPRTQWVGLSRVKDENNEWDVWYLISNRWQSATQMADARIADIKAWARFFALFAFALLILVSLAIAILLRDPKIADQLLRRIASRRRGRCEFGLVNAMLKLLQHDSSLFAWLDPRRLLNLEASFSNVS